MKLTARDQDQQNALAHAYHGRERFTLTGAGLQAEFVAEVLNRVPCAFGSRRYETNLELVQVTEATTKAAWNGEGLPPVGTVCEWHPNMHGWVEVTILGYDGGDTWYRIKGEDHTQICRNMAFFRPIRTPEKIAKEERSKECDVMYGVILALPEDRSHNRSDICEALYDAGYRKQ